MKRFDVSKIKHVVFDVDGTLYTKDIEYTNGAGTIQTAHDFFRFQAFQMLRDGKQSPQSIASLLIGEYLDGTDSGTLKDTVARISRDDIKVYEGFVKQYGSNGKVFAGEFGQDSKYLHRMLQHIRFDRMLADDPELRYTFSYLKDKGLDLGILTTEVYDTVTAVAKAMGFALDDFRMDTGDNLGIFCAENVASKKPSPEGFEKTIKAYKAEDPTAIVYVGDHFKKDIEAPMKLGIQAVHVLTKGPDVSYKTAVIDGQLKQYAVVNGVYNLKKLF